MKSVSHESIVKELQKFVEENIIDYSVELEPNTSFRDLGVDSFSVIQIVLYIERKFNVTIDDSDLTADNLKSIHSLSEFVFKHS